MSNDTHKADQIAFHFYTKLFYVLNDGRATSEPRTQPKVDKWVRTFVSFYGVPCSKPAQFNLETPDSDLFTKEAREPYRNISLSTPPGPPPLEIQVLLSIPEFTNNKVLVYISPDSSRIRIEPTPRFILLESWTLAFTAHPEGDDDGVDVALPTIYKHGIPLFRSLFSLLRVLPAWKLYKRLKRRTGGIVKNGHLGIQLRVRASSESEYDDTQIMLFGKSCFCADYSKLNVIQIRVACHLHSQLNPTPSPQCPTPLAHSHSPPFTFKHPTFSSTSSSPSSPHASSPSTLASSQHSPRTTNVTLSRAPSPPAVASPHAHPPSQSQTEE